MRTRWTLSKMRSRGELPVWCSRLCSLNQPAHRHLGYEVADGHRHSCMNLAVLRLRPGAELHAVHTVPRLGQQIEPHVDRQGVELERLVGH